MTRKVSFLASMSTGSTAITISGGGDGAKLRLEIPQSNSDVIPLIQMFFLGVPIHVTFERAGEYAEELGHAEESADEL